MSTKTIALDAKVYDRLAVLKRGSESFSKLISKLIDKAVEAHTVTQVLARLDEEVPPLSGTDAEAMQRVVKESRKMETWPPHDLS